MIITGGLPGTWNSNTLPYCRCHSASSCSRLPPLSTWVVRGTRWPSTGSSGGRGGSRTPGCGGCGPLCWLWTALLLLAGCCCCCCCWWAPPATLATVKQRLRMCSTARVWCMKTFGVPALTCCRWSDPALYSVVQHFWGTSVRAGPSNLHESIATYLWRSMALVEATRHEAGREGPARTPRCCCCCASMLLLLLRRAEQRVRLCKPGGKTELRDRRVVRVWSLGRVTGR